MMFDKCVLFISNGVYVLLFYLVMMFVCFGSFVFFYLMCVCISIMCFCRAPRKTSFQLMGLSC